MRETLGEKIKRIFQRKNDSVNAVKEAQLQPDILDIALQDGLTHDGTAAVDGSSHEKQIVLKEISEDGPRFTPEDLSQMSEGSWKPAGEPAIEEMLVEVPEISEVKSDSESSAVNPLLESMAEDSAAIEALASQMDSMAFFTTEGENDKQEGNESSEEPEQEEILAKEVSSLEEMATDPDNAQEEPAADDNPEDSDVFSEAETEAAALIAETVEVSKEAPIDGMDSSDGTSLEIEPNVSNAEENGDINEDIIAEEPDEKGEDLSEEANCESVDIEDVYLEDQDPDSVIDQDVSATSEVSEELSDLWGLNRTQEEIEKEEVHDWLKRHIIRAAVLLILFGVIGSGAYAYEQGWRINLFYEVQHTTEEGTAENGKKKRPDSSEFFIKPTDNPESNTEANPESSENGNKKDPLSEIDFEDIELDFDDPEEIVEPEKEFVGITISKEEDPEKISEEGPTGNLEKPDQVKVEETGPVQTVEVERAVNYYLSADGAVREIRSLPGEIKTVQDLLDKANVTVTGDDIVEPSLSSSITEGSTVKITRILFKTVTETEIIPGQAIERLTPVLRSGRTYAINQDNQADGEKEVTYKEKYVNGVLESREEISSTVVKEPTDYILLVGANIPASPINGAYYTDVQILDNVPAEYSAVYSGRCTAYNFRKGAYGASGMYLSQGMVAVDPSIIPYGSLLYITNSDGSFVYGWAIACDYCEASAAGSAVVDLFFDTYRECTLFGARSLNVYVVKQLTQSDLSGYVAKEGMFRSRVPA
ncbi:MAG: G5 domain-containing protein [Parasporobacterium sp.]|nr:G5 domain-containing protein [Parasporobacterium sp.]